MLDHRLDHFLIKDRLIGNTYNYRQGVGTGGLSNHSPIYLEISGLEQKPKSPFKFNASWLKDPDYLCLVSNYWKARSPVSSRSISARFSNNLTNLKRISMRWAHRKPLQDDNTLLSIEVEISNLEDEYGRGY